MNDPQTFETFRRESTFSCTAAALYAFHERQDVFALLTPPGSVLQVLADRRTSLQDGDLEFRLWLGPIPVSWHARHQAGPTATSFIDVQEEGPLAFWEHTHLVEEAPEKNGEPQARLIDSIRFRHHSGLAGVFSRVAFGGAALAFLFSHRHRVTRKIVENPRK